MLRSLEEKTGWRRWPERRSHLLRVLRMPRAKQTTVGGGAVATSPSVQPFKPPPPRVATFGSPAKASHPPRPSSEKRKAALEDAAVAEDRNRARVHGANPLARRRLDQVPEEYRQEVEQRVNRPEVSRVRRIPPPLLRSARTGAAATLSRVASHRCHLHLHRHRRYQGRHRHRHPHHPHSGHRRRLYLNLHHPTAAATTAATVAAAAYTPHAPLS